MIIATTSKHREGLLSVLTESGQFDDESIDHVMATLDTHLDTPGDEIWLTAIDDGPVGFAYCAPEPVTSGTWNLLMLWTKEGYQGKGIGSSLVAAVETQLRANDARLLIVETSSLPEFETARSFYVRYGFVFEAKVKDFFTEGDDKLIYTRRQDRSD